MEDSKIVQLYWERDERAISATAEKYGNYCRSIAHNILNNSEDARECVNDTYMRAWQAIPPHRPERLSTFLGKITRNLSLSRYQHDTRAKRGGGEAAAVFDEIAELVSDTDSVEQAVDYQELVDAINAFLDGLSSSRRDVFVRRYWYFDSIPQIAARFASTENRISVTLSRLRLALRKYLLERGFDL